MRHRLIGYEGIKIVSNGKHFQIGIVEALIISNCQDAGNCRRPWKEQRSQKNEGAKVALDGLPCGVAGTNGATDHYS